MQFLQSKVQRRAPCPGSLDGGLKTQAEKYRSRTVDGHTRMVAH